MIKFLAWLEVNKKRVLIWAGVGLGVVLVGVVVAVLQAQREVRADHALSDINVPPNLSADPPAGTTEAYLKVARDYAGTEAAGRALLLHASLLFNQKNYADAQARFEEFLREYPSSEWVPQGLFGVASCLDAQKKAGDAIAKYEELRRRFPTDVVVEEARLCLARLYEEGNRLEEALQIYEELAQTRAGTGMGAEAGMRKEDLLDRHPELAKTNLPAILPAPTLDTSLTNLPVMVVTNVQPAATNQGLPTPPVQMDLKTTAPGVTPVPTPAPAPAPTTTTNPVPTTTTNPVPATTTNPVPATSTNPAPAPPG